MPLKFTTATLLILAALCAPAGAGFAAEGDLLGRWTTHKGGQIDFEKCGDRICGHVAKLARQDHTTPPTDRKNPDPALRSRPLLGLQLFAGFEHAGEDRWTNGRIYNVENGKTYKSKLQLLPDDQLKLSGCVFIFCRSYIWNRTIPTQEQRIDQ